MGSITVLLTSCLTGLESAVLQLTIFVFIYKPDKSKLEVNCTVILPPLMFPATTLGVTSLLVRSHFVVPNVYRENGLVPQLCLLFGQAGAATFPLGREY